MSGPFPTFDMRAALRGELPPVHPDFGPFGDQAYLEVALELIGPLPNLNEWKVEMGRPGPCGGMTWCRPVMRGYLWRTAQRFNEASFQDKSIGTWKAHMTRMDNVFRASKALVKAMDRLQEWERKSMELAWLVDDGIINQIDMLRSSADWMRKESITATTPHRFMNGSPKARLARHLLVLWNLAPSVPPAGREGHFSEFVHAIAHLALKPGATDRERSMDRAIRDALSHTGGRTPYPLTGESPHMGWQWGEATGQKEG